MTRRFAVFDIDGTLFRWQLFHELIFELADQGALPPEFKAEIAPPLADWHNRRSSSAFHDYELRLVQAFSRHLRGLSVADFRACVQIVIDRSGDRVYRYTRDYLQRLRDDDYCLIAISGSFAEIVEVFAEKYGFNYWVGSRCHHQAGRFTGQADWMYNQKGPALRQLVERHQLSWAGSVAVGDTASDIPMLELVEHPLAFNPNDELLAHAMHRGWKVVVERKNVAYELTSDTAGYRLLTIAGAHAAADQS